MPRSPGGRLLGRATPLNHWNRWGLLRRRVEGAVGQPLASLGQPGFRMVTRCFVVLVPNSCEAQLFSQDVYRCVRYAYTL